MFKLIKYLFLLIIVGGIAGFAYLYTRPATFEYHYKAHFEQVSTKTLIRKITDFQDWKNWAIIDTSLYKTQPNKDVLLRSLETSILHPQQFRLENDAVLKDEVVQKLITQGSDEEQVLRWQIEADAEHRWLHFHITENLSLKDRFLELIGQPNLRRTWLQSLGKRMKTMEYQVNHQAFDYKLSDIHKKALSPIHYIYLSGVASFDQIENVSEKHLIALEDYIIAQDIKGTKAPFQMYTSDIKADKIAFRTAIEVRDSLSISSFSDVKYARLDGGATFELEVLGNPKSMLSVWKHFADSKEIAINDMSATKVQFQVSETTNTADDFAKKQQKLIWLFKAEEAQ